MSNDMKSCSIDIYSRLGKIEGKQDAILASFTDIKSMMKDQDAEIKRIDRKQNWFTGVGAGAMSLLSLAMAYVKTGGLQ